MLNPIPYITGCLTLTENFFNVVGYLPKRTFPSLHVWGVRWRRNQGKVLLITGLALTALGYSTDYLFPSLATGSYLSTPLQTASLGLLLANHGAFNIIRSYVEKVNIPGITLAYDFYGKKVLPPMNPEFDLLGTLFCKIKNLLNRIVFISVFPPQFVFT